MTAVGSAARCRATSNPHPDCRSATIKARLTKNLLVLSSLRDNHPNTATRTSHPDVARFSSRLSRHSSPRRKGRACCRRFPRAAGRWASSARAHPSSPRPEKTSRSALDTLPAVFGTSAMRSNKRPFVVRREKVCGRSPSHKPQNIYLISSQLPLGQSLPCLTAQHLERRRRTARSDSSCRHERSDH
jgi:hypothetical protein